MCHSTKKPAKPKVAQSAKAVEYTECISAEKKNSHNECPGYYTKQSDGEVLVMLELWGMRSTPSLPSLPDRLSPGLVAPDRVLSMGQIKINCMLMIICFGWNWNVLKLKLRTVLNCLKRNCFFMPNWIVRNTNVFFFTSKLHLGWVELFEIVLFWQKLYLY